MTDGTYKKAPYRRNKAFDRYNDKGFLDYGAGHIIPKDYQEPDCDD